MGNGESKPRQVKITSQDRAILDLKLQRDKLKQYQKRIEHVLEREKEIARIALRQGNKARALTALRQRKYQETLLSQTDTQLETLQQLVSSIEFSLVEKDVLFGLQQGNKVLTELNKGMSLDMVEKLMSDTQEAVEYQRQVNDMLSSTLSADEEDQVLEELARLQEAEAASKHVELPNAPVHSLPQRTEPQQQEVEQAAATPERQAIPA